MSRNMERITAELQQLCIQLHQIWLSETLFTWRWWLLALLTVLPWLFWVFYRKKDSTYRLLLAGFFAVAVSKLMDTLGASFGLWEYNVRVLPLIPPLFPWDTTLLPVAVMVLIQFKPMIKPVFKALLFSVFASFVVEPAAMWLGLYQPIHWSHLYSLVIFIVIYLAADWLSRRRSFERVAG